MLVASGNPPGAFAAASRVSANSGESWRLAGTVTVPSGIPLASTAADRAFRAPLSAVHRAPARLLAAARRFGDATINGHVREFQADEAVVSRQRHLPQGIHQPELDPLVAPVPKRGGRARLVGDP